MTYYQIDGKLYYINLDNLFKYVAEISSKEKPINTTITQFYGGEDEDMGGDDKQIVETKANVNDTMNTVRYDVIKYIISCLFENNVNSDGIPVGINHLNELTFAQGVCLNTLLKHKILLEVETDE
jgi:hypothetical protein